MIIMSGICWFVLVSIYLDMVILYNFVNMIVSYSCYGKFNKCNYNEDDFFFWKCNKYRGSDVI